ncbi:MAG: amino acid--tRNA ligase-related protein [bacterium]
MTENILAVSAALQAGRKSLQQRGYHEIVVPRVVRATGACENVNTLFEVSVKKDFNWFGGKAYLAQTGQLYLEALVPQLKKVYCVGPSFRAEDAIDNRHLTEFLMMEIEFAGGFDDLLKEIEIFIKDVAQGIIAEAEKNKFKLPETAAKRLAACPKEFPKITYDEAIEMLKEMGEIINWGDDISSAQEQMLTQYFLNQPVFITRYPDPMWDHVQEIEVEKFFNMLPDPKNPGRVLSSDLILPHGGEAVGSAARVHDADEMIKRLKGSRMYKRLKELGGSLEDFDWYINELKKGSVPHAGCGFGMARIIKWALGTEEIKQAVHFFSNKAHLI